MLGGNLVAFLCSSGHEGTAGEVVGPAQQTARALMDSCDGLVGEQVVGDPGHLEVMNEVELHLLARDTLEVAAGDDARTQGLTGAELELIDEVVLPGEDQRQQGAGVALEMADRVQLG